VIIQQSILSVVGTCETQISTLVTRYTWFEDEYVKKSMKVSELERQNKNMEVEKQKAVDSNPKDRYNNNYKRNEWMKVKADNSVPSDESKHCGMKDMAANSVPADESKGKGRPSPLGSKSTPPSRTIIGNNIGNRGRQAAPERVRRPVISEKNMNYLFNPKNYYGDTEFANLVGLKMIQWERRGNPQLDSMLTTNDKFFLQATSIVRNLMSKIPLNLVVQAALRQSIANNLTKYRAAEEARIAKARLDARQERERREQRRKIEDAKRMREDLSDAMYGMSPKRPTPPPVSVRFAQPVQDSRPEQEGFQDDYDYGDGFAVEDHDSQPEDDDLGALSDAVEAMNVHDAEYLDKD